MRASSGPPGQGRMAAVVARALDVKPRLWPVVGDGGASTHAGLPCLSCTRNPELHARSMHACPLPAVTWLNSMHLALWTCNGSRVTVLPQELARGSCHLTRGECAKSHNRIRAPGVQTYPWRITGHSTPAEHLSEAAKHRVMTRRAVSHRTCR